MDSKAKRYNRITTLLKWLVAMGVLCYLFLHVDKDRLFQAMDSARIELYAPLAAFFVILWFLIESQNLMFLFNMFGHGLTFREMRMIRGASYMVMIINYNLGLGAIAWYLKRRNGIPLSRAGSVMFFYYFVESVGITFFAAAGCLLVFSQFPELYGKVILAAGIMFLSYIFLFFLIRFIPEEGRFGRIRKNPLLSTFYEADFPSYFKLSGFRAVYFFSFVVFFYFGLLCFDVHVPFISLIGLVPVIFFIGNIPVTPFGIGTIQAAMQFFFKPFGQAESILAFSVIYSATLLFLRAPIGLLYMRETQTDFTDIQSIEA
jgi:uncharacterized membrane protein YbhN (UPF0104 family)